VGIKPGFAAATLSPCDDKSKVKNNMLRIVERTYRENLDAR
jgi:hypothetical protein